MKKQLLEVEAWDGSAVRTLRFATNGYQAARSDTPPDVVYDARIKSPILMERHAVGAGRTRGDSTPSIGTIEIVNNDGDLDDILTYAFAGRPVRVLVVEDNQPLASAITLFTGVMEQPEFEWSLKGGKSTIPLVVRDQSVFTDKPIQTARYGGTNSLPGGRDGTAELTAKWKPRLFGFAARIPAPCVNTAMLIYQINDGPIADVPAAYDRGVPLGRGPDYASLDELESTNPAAGTYRVWPAGGLVRLAGMEDGLITFDAVEGATAADRYPGALIRRVLTTAGVDPANIDTAALAALDAACPYECGCWAAHDNEVKASEILDWLVTSVGGWWAAGADTVFRAGVMNEASGEPVAELNASNLVALSRRQSRDNDRGIPPRSVTIGYARYWRTQDSGLAGSITPAQAADLREEYRAVVVTDLAVAAAYPTAPEIRIDTLLRHAADAAAVAASRHAVLKVRRDPIEAEAYVEAAAAIDIGKLVRVRVNRYGMSAGRLFWVTGVSYDARIDRVKLSLWG